VGKDEEWPPKPVFAGEEQNKIGETVELGPSGGLIGELLQLNAKQHFVYFGISIPSVDVAD
jgi:hypothetical protein